MTKLPSKGTRPAGPKEYGRPSSAVSHFVTALAHGHKPELVALRKLILAANPDIQEGIKWNAPSFWCGEWFATFHLHAKTGLSLVLHRGAKTKSAPRDKFIEDPDALLSWKTDDRCTLSVSDAQDLKRKSAAIGAIIRDWSTKVALESTEPKRT